MLSSDLLAQMDDKQVLAIAQVEQDPLTSTPLELELARRLSAWCGQGQILLQRIDKLDAALVEFSCLLDRGVEEAGALQMLADHARLALAGVLLRQPAKETATC